MDHRDDGRRGHPPIGGSAGGNRARGAPRDRQGAAPPPASRARRHAPHSDPRLYRFRTVGQLTHTRRRVTGATSSGLGQEQSLGRRLPRGRQSSAMSPHWGQAISTGSRGRLLIGPSWSHLPAGACPRRGERR